jgi:hypothetical protein
MRLLELVGLNCFEDNIMGSKWKKKKKKRGGISKMRPRF